jgi:signal-transduction protein with cAMP-binding, CBS, and nucleotidyltransferase domain
LPGVTDADSLSDLTRLTDISPLTISDESDQELKEMAFTQLRKSRLAQATLIGQMESYSNGIGIMGGLKLERNGVGRGLFHLWDHGLLPLSSALSALALIKNSSSVTSCERILDLLMRRELDVDLAEKMLEAWHSLHELRLRHERSSRFGTLPESSFFLDPDELTDIERQTLKTALASVAAIQRHIAISYSAGWGE